MKVLEGVAKSLLDGERNEVVDLEERRVKISEGRV